MLTFVVGLLATLFVSTLVGVYTARALMSRPHAALLAGAIAAVATLVVLAVHILVPLANDSRLWGGYPWQALVTDYVLGMGHRLYGGPYAFFWTPPWIYPVTALTPLLAPGAALTIACAYVGRRTNPVLASALIIFGGLIITGFTVAFAYVGFSTGNGIPV